jgi:hypothetical protein
MVQASVCGLPGSKVLYSPGEAVVVGFLDNEIDNPVILGSYLTSGREHTTVSNIVLDLGKGQLLSTHAQPLLSMDTQFID